MSSVFITEGGKIVADFQKEQFPVDLSTLGQFAQLIASNGGTPIKLTLYQDVVTLETNFSDTGILKGGHQRIITRARIGAYPQNPPIDSNYFVHNDL